jgi:hypothetical protein
MERDESTSIPAADTSSDSGASRRGLLSKGVKFAVATSALLAFAPGAAAYAAHGPKNKGPSDDADDPDDDQGPGNRGRGRGPLVRRPFYALILCPVKQVGGNDFTPSGGSPGSDPLRSGVVRVFRAQGTATSLRIWVQLRGAAANTPYTVAFVRFNDHVRESLGTITTNANGDVTAFTPTMLSGTVRVGVFVIINNNNGSDQFVSCVP